MVRSLFAAILITLFAAPAMAQPGMKSTGFSTMDKDGDGAVTWEEYHEAIPNMKRAAFDAMDANKDGTLTPDERGTFMNRHGKEAKASQMGGGMEMPPKGMMGMPPKGKDGKPMLMPPTDTHEHGPNDGHDHETKTTKPLLTPPSN